MKQLLIILGAIIAVAFIWWQAATVDLIPDLGKTGVETTATAAAKAPVAASDSDAEGPEREVADPATVAADPTADPEVPAGPPPAAPPPPLQLLVVDGAGEPVGGAEVAIFENVDRRRGLELIRLRSDAIGRCAAPLAGDLIVSARRADLGWSGDVLVQARGRDEVHRIVLLSTATVRGRVTLPDGAPAALALVWIRSAAYADERTDRVPSQRTDADGRFEVEVIAGRAGSEHTFFARLQERASVLAPIQERASERVDVPELAPGEVVEIELRFPGRFRVRGKLLTAAGEPLQGRVWLVRRAGAPGRALRRTTADTIGAFEFLLTDGGEFTVVGGVEGRTSGIADVRVEEGSPVAEVELRTQPFVAVAGRVVDEGGMPLAGIHVGLSHGFERDVVERQRSSLHGILPRGDTTADGTFEFLVPAGYRYQLVARPVAGNARLLVRGPKFVAPAQDLVLTIRGADRQGLVLFGEVTARATGQPIAQGKVQMVTQKGAGSSMGRVGQIVAGAFETERLAPGQRAWFEFQAPGYAPRRHGPFDLGTGRQRLDVKLEALGTMRVRVHRPDGTPAAGYRVVLSFEPFDPFGPAWQGKTNEQGTIEFDDVIPREYRVIARAPSEIGGEGESPGVVVAGQRTAVEVFVER